jgi:chromosomal replication initiation ATPase DnaA
MVFVEEGIAEGYRKEFHKGSQEGRLLGDDDFVDDALTRSGQGDCWRISTDEIIDFVSDAYSISPTDLERPGKERRFSEARNVAALLVRDCEHLSLTEFGSRVNRDISSLSQGVSRLLKRAEADRNLSEKIEMIQSRLKYP